VLIDKEEELVSSINDEILIANSARTHIIGIMQHAFSSPPTIEQIEVFCGNPTTQALSLFTGNGYDVYDKAVKDFCGVVGEKLSAKELTLEDLTRNYNLLFVGPGELAAAPWESVYTSPRRLLFQRSTLEVRKAYNSEGFVFSSYPKEPDDHLAAELSFIYQLSLRFNAAAKARDVQECQRLTTVQHAFETQHLLNWITEFDTAIQMAHKANKIGGYFSALSTLLMAF
jgi:TorA maturation chaperone TorD